MHQREIETWTVSMYPRCILDAERLSARMGALEHRHDVGAAVVALTFDDGPSQWTHAILDLLAQHGGHATFFALGCLADAPEGRETLRNVIAAGSEVGNHTFSHPSLPTVDDAAIRDELERGGAAIEDALGTSLRYWRPPFFHVDERVRAAAAPLGLQEVGCSMMPWDWEWDADRSASFVLERLQPGSIVCMHDGRPPDEPAELSAPTREQSVAAVGMILEAMSERGLRSATISELLAA
jgi:peptidoglycan-N-acetylglucosamine deacetylase